MNSLQTRLGSRFNMTLWVLVVVFLIIVLQDSLTAGLRIEQIVPSTLRGFAGFVITNRVLLVVKILIFVPVVLFWILDQRKYLRLTMLTSLGLLTFELLASVAFLALSLRLESDDAQGLIRDTLLVAAINVLTFSLWYWIIDAEPLQTSARTDVPTDFLFPQYASALAKFQNWRAQYVDYLFLAFTTTTAFGPTDTLPLSRRAKVLMMLQALLSLIIIVVLAGRALGILK